MTTAHLATLTARPDAAPTQQCHRVYRITDWLLQLSEFPDLLASRPVRSELVYVLVGLDKQYTAGGVETPWPEFYASQLVERFGAASRS